MIWVEGQLWSGAFGLPIGWPGSGPVFACGFFMGNGFQKARKTGAVTRAAKVVRPVRFLAARNPCPFCASVEFSHTDAVGGDGEMR
jgi:hypothetical protein